MRKLLALILLTFCGGYNFGQSFQVNDLLGHNISGTTQVLFQHADEIVFESQVMNTSGSEKKVMTKKIVELKPTGTINYFCWAGLCIYNGTVSEVADTVGAGEISDSFTGHFINNGNTDTCKITYVFYDMNNPNDSVFVKVRFVYCPVSVHSMVKPAILQVYPNPASSYINIQYSLANTPEAIIVIRDILGNVIRNITINSQHGLLTINLEELNPGIYFYSLSLGSKTYTSGRFQINR